MVHEMIGKFITVCWDKCITVLLEASSVEVKLIVSSIVLRATWEDLYCLHPLIQDLIWDSCYILAKPLLTHWPLNKLREKALQVTMKHIHYADENNRYITIGCTEKVLCMLACWVEDPNGDYFKKHLAMFPDYMWVVEDGMKGQILTLGLQVKDNPFGDFRSMYRHISKGSWTFSDQDHGWQVSDSTATGLKCCLLFSMMPPEIVGEKMESERLYNVVNILLSLQCDEMSNCCSFPLLLPLMNFSFPDRCRFRHTLVISAVGRRRHHRRRLLKYSPLTTTPPTPTIFKLSDNTLQITLKSPSNSIQQLESKLNHFIEYSREAFDDLRTVVTVDGDNGGLVISSCRRSTIEFFVALLLVSSLIVIISFRGLFKFGRRNRGEEEELVYKRDRSLGGREVLVGKRPDTNWSTTTTAGSRNLTPLGSDTATNYYYPNEINRNQRNTRRKKELPQWWPHLVNSGPHDTINKEEYQRMANQLIRDCKCLHLNVKKRYCTEAIMDRKMSGMDISTNDIVQIHLGF
ncbi:hypothetical protein BUALT_Bualt09G0011100 [Buddleja alternifolia]|uniref:Uncharacterized protein n=1 Tax=Buddleja alternifolia TaxID=168488 RepID=A0AAV6X0Q9_9LAMI|nr:hypothetical protein BUALT_Bualt09G0011100 [Buddleja alternifolia]